MAQSMKEVLPKGDYKIKNVGPSRDWDFNGNAMRTYSIQLEGHENMWVDVNQKADSAAPAIGDTLKGHVEQDDQGKYAPKFKKESSGNWSGNRGGQASPGAVWSTAMHTAATIVAGYYQAAGTKPKNIKDYFSKVKALAPKVNEAVDAFVAANKETKPAADTAATESGETQTTPAPAPASQQQADLAIEDISDEELGDW